MSSNEQPIPPLLPIDFFIIRINKPNQINLKLNANRHKLCDVDAIGDEWNRDNLIVNTFIHKL